MSTNMKNVIAEACVAMIRRDGMETITVKDLVQVCHISRQTFYYHFQDIMDVIEWAAYQTIRKALEVSIPQENPEKAIRAFVDVVMVNHEALERAMESPRKRIELEQIVVDAIKDYLRQMMRQELSDLVNSGRDPEIALQFYAVGIAGVLLDQCRREDFDAEKVSSELSKLLRVGLVSEKIGRRKKSEPDTQNEAGKKE
ncbi:MAG: TetR family transcriptional regulator [Ruminiclostridium sp.]|nr:TetR family transcriptional regulator [Ruminiclostridium sp.]